ncbi:hypothetical protein SSBR45G_48110 [Bradyrhizobium sp. SSBR45G]|uniref:hypothetical protein n=1 Tax=unclassified Bradyrhizobium TaxID=2631580 RepID=UPI0023429710|nr:MULTISPECIES: hypothetical protein [unclassified Bradyrhizobium]GLH79902.1 hypothetical protein SSBR45G_48110 [Bradyrhizobium sp. SSBR45G]GLH87278.1 hypothetical protein SSBR45R_47380 [Bradyrhizobium sp. SSBR45R]
MKPMISLFAFALVVSATSALAQGGQPTTSPTSAQNSGAGIQGAPGNKNGASIDNGSGTVGAAPTINRQNPDVSAQDPSNIKGMPGNKNGPPAKKPQN